MLSDLNRNGGSGNGRGRRNGRRNSGSKGKVIGLFRYVSSDDDTRSTINNINRNYPSQKLGLINVYYTMVHKFLDPSNPINLTLNELTNVKNYTSQFSGHISNYNTIKWFLIPRLDRLTRPEFTTSLELLKSVRNNNGNGIYGKYERIKPKAEYCKTSLECEVERLESISKNATMLQKQLEMLIDIINKHKTIENKLKEFSKKLSKMKEKKDRSMNYLKWLVSSIETNLGKIQKISNCLKCSRHCVSITTIKKDIENIYSAIKDINNILSIVKSQLTLLRPVNFGFDLSPICEIECCIKEIVCGIHLKYCSLSSDISKNFSDSPTPGLTLADDCKLPEIVECTCATQPSSEPCASCQDCGGTKGCQFCECLKQLSTSCPDSSIKQKIDCINKVICKLINGKPVDGCLQSQNGQQCSHSFCTTQQAQVTISCETTQQRQTTGTANDCQQTTNIGQLIESTLVEITKCQKSLVKCEDKELPKCEQRGQDTGRNSCQITPGTQPSTSCSPTTAPSVVKCNELDKAKLCIDTMVNKCNCCQLKEFLNDKKLKSCVEVFKWIFIYNFSQLFCLYTGFDKSILNEISCIMEKLEQSKFYLKVITFIHGEINCRIDCIKSEINESTKNLESLVKIMRSGINRTVLDLECAIEGVPRNFIRCSLQSLIKNNTVTVMKDNREDNQLESQVVSMDYVLKM